MEKRLDLEEAQTVGPMKTATTRVGRPQDAGIRPPADDWRKLPTEVRAERMRLPQPSVGVTQCAFASKVGRVVTRDQSRVNGRNATSQGRRSQGEDRKPRRLQGNGQKNANRERLAFLIVVELGSVKPYVNTGVPAGSGPNPQRIPPAPSSVPSPSKITPRVGGNRH